MLVDVKAIKSITYNGRVYVAQDKFKMTQELANRLNNILVEIEKPIKSTKKRVRLDDK